MPKKKRKPRQKNNTRRKLSEQDAAAAQAWPHGEVEQPNAKPYKLIVPFILAIVVGGLAALLLWPRPRQNTPQGRNSAQTAGRNQASSEPASDGNQGLLERETRYYQQGNLTLLWDPMKPAIRAQVQPVSLKSNITPNDYVGPQACEECHRENHAHWVESSHKKMNALASSDSVLGDFSGDAELKYRGGNGHVLSARWQVHDAVRA